jgi:ADP-ribose pyrophosphatase YjhB (NUDIX family)
MFIGTDGKIMTVIGKKAKAPSVKIQFESGSVSVLKVGLHGDTIVGEHIEPAEKAGLFASLAAFTASGAPFLELNEKAAGAAIRAMAEESGLKIERNARYFMIGEDTKDGRDPRYWKCGTLYGYPRKSRSVMIVVVLQCEMPANMPDPLDRVECDKARILPFDFVLKEFHKEGKLKPAFDAHVRQLQAVASVLPEIMKAL